MGLFKENKVKPRKYTIKHTLLDRKYVLYITLVNKENQELIFETEEKREIMFSKLQSKKFVEMVDDKKKIEIFSENSHYLNTANIVLISKITLFHYKVEEFKDDGIFRDYEVTKRFKEKEISEVFY